MRDYALKVSPNNPTSLEEVILGDIPPNVISFKEYVAKRNSELALCISPKLKRGDWERAHISRLYRLLVLPYFPKERLTLDHYNLFLHTTLPFVVRNCTFEGLNGVCNAFYHRNKERWLRFGIRYKTFKKRCMAIVANCFIPEVPDHPSVEKFLHREALRIIWSLAGHKGVGNASVGHFFLTGRDLQARLFVKHKKTAQRILERFCENGILTIVRPGIERREAKRLGIKATSTSYRLELKA